YGDNGLVTFTNGDAHAEHRHPHHVVIGTVERIHEPPDTGGVIAMTAGFLAEDGVIGKRLANPGNDAPLGFVVDLRHHIRAVALGLDPVVRIEPLQRVATGLAGEPDRDLAHVFQFLLHAYTPVTSR